jgi:hypothetical protein
MSATRPLDRVALNRSVEDSRVRLTNYVALQPALIAYQDAQGKEQACLVFVVPGGAAYVIPPGAVAGGSADWARKAAPLTETLCRQIQEHLAPVRRADDGLPSGLPAEDAVDVLGKDA